jgi:hypothetical protein
MGFSSSVFSLISHPRGGGRLHVTWAWIIVLRAESVLPTSYSHGFSYSAWLQSIQKLRISNSLDDKKASEHRLGSERHVMISPLGAGFRVPVIGAVWQNKFARKAEASLLVCRALSIKKVDRSIHAPLHFEYGQGEIMVSEIRYRQWLSADPYVYVIN